MKTRIVTGLAIGVVILAFVFLGGWWFSIFVTLMATIAMMELLKMKKIQALSLRGIAGLISMWLLLIPTNWFDQFIPIENTKIELFIFLILILLMLTVLTKNKLTFDEVGFIILSSVYVGFGFHFLIEARNVTEVGLWLVLFVIILIWTTDSGAYFVGKAMGKHKLWPEISPNKTIEGSLGGIVLAVIVGSLFFFLTPAFTSYITAVFIMLATAVFGQIGDLVESALKRHYAVKDSGNVLPGHGGILDRFDSLIFVMPLLHLLQLI
ncbi:MULTISPECIES: phosphatidate cytidylyltransferase [Shouchella]|uniref:Phosphatidate cytidylyltransferase n=3 Tax=Bacillaceae TaxID=186817 RepID=A0A060LX75_9BACI|nr:MULTISPECIES: phosphatidate cytidylyltransferase [Bacillaceae]RQW20648.1 phosphatidate cytidylyltransferase [Bacillus sp. C1-1]AIC94802.1 phosphatidate cytidylyltransferase [Shouchella lehensis G1]KQL58662.1 phosphatidate cytidylyltransferase [Alkalicoccobacillus plakortidis]MBG9784339.1 phosphatidate cytidylyltransferase [Shouchella lehensis]TES50668.1 phosphatidate cytidylyltransferase [Shouchella lehensis]